MLQSSDPDPLTSRRQEKNLSFNWKKPRLGPGLHWGLMRPGGEDGKRSNKREEKTSTYWVVQGESV